MAAFYKGNKIDSSYLYLPHQAYMRFFKYNRIKLFAKQNPLMFLSVGVLDCKYSFLPVRESMLIIKKEKEINFPRPAHHKMRRVVKYHKKYLFSIKSYKQLMHLQHTIRKHLNSYYGMAYASHPWNIVDRSPWPFISGMASFFFLLGLVSFFHGHGASQLGLGFLSVLASFFLWNRDIVREGTFHGRHTSFVQTTLKTGFKYFIASELMLFVSFFWAFYNFYFNGSIETAYVYPPLGMAMDDKLPSIMNLILLLSACIITASHLHLKMALNHIHIYSVLDYLFFTILLGFIFICCQVYEYCHNSFTFSDSSLGSIFYLLTGCHSLHVIIGVTFLFVTYIRMILNHTTFDHNLNYILSVWYWHFVDIIWVFVYLKLYYLFHYIKKTQLIKRHYTMYDFSGGSMYLDYPLGLGREYYPF